MSRFNFVEKLSATQKISIAQIQIGHVQEGSILSEFNLSSQLGDGITLEHYGNAKEANLFLIMLMPTQASVTPGLIIICNYDDKSFQAFSLGYELEEKNYAALATFLSHHTQDKKLEKRLVSYAKGVMFCVDMLVENIVAMHVRNGINEQAIQVLAYGLESVGLTSEQELKQARHELQLTQEREAALLQEMISIQDTVSRLEKEKTILSQQLQFTKRLSQQAVDQHEVVVAHDSKCIIERQQQELIQLKRKFDVLRLELAQKKQNEDEIYIPTLKQLERVQQAHDALALQCDDLWKMLAEERKKHDRLQRLEQEQLGLEEHCRILMQKLSQQQQVFSERLSQQVSAPQASAHVSWAEELAQCHISAGDVLDQQQKMQLLQQLLILCRELDHFCKLSQSQLVDVQLEKMSLQIEQERRELTHDTLMKRSFYRRLTNKPVTVEDEALESKRQDMATKRQQYAEQSIALSTQFSGCVVDLLQMLCDFNAQIEIESVRCHKMINQFSDLMAAQITQIQKILVELYPKYSNISRNIKCFFLLSALDSFKQSHPNLGAILATLTEQFTYDQEALEVEQHVIPSDIFIEKLRVLNKFVENIDPIIQAASVNPVNGLQPVMLTYMHDLKQIVTNLSWYRQYVGLSEAIKDGYAAEVTRCMQEVQASANAQEQEHLAQHVGNRAHAQTVASVGKTAQSMMVGNQLAGEAHAISPQIIAYAQFCKLLLCWHTVLAHQISGKSTHANFDETSINAVIELFVQSRRPILKSIYHEHNIDLAAEMHVTVSDVDRFQEKMQRAIVLKQALPGAFARAFMQQLVQPLSSSIKESIDAVGIFTRFPSLVAEQLKALSSENSFA